MKKLFLKSAIWIFFIALCYAADAQNKAKLDNEKTTIEYAKNSDETRPAFGETFSPKKSKAIKNFESSFKNASNQKWYDDSYGFMVKFEDQNGVKCRTDYDRKGNWIANTRYYGEKELPKEIRKQVMMEYFDFKIHSVQEVTIPEHKAYFIQIFDDKKWVHLKIIDGEMIVDKAFNKTN